MSRKPQRRRPSASRPIPARKKPAPSPLLHETVLFTSHQRELITKRRGELAELACSLKAVTLGFGVSKPYGDSERYDTIIDARDLTASEHRCHPNPPPTNACITQHRLPQPS